MSPAENSRAEAELLRRIGANNPKFIEWLEAERAGAVSVLTFNTTPAVMHQHQGKIQFLEILLKMLSGGGK
jgi:hypothetical protein